MVKAKELIICIISIIALALAITTNVFATNTPGIEELLGNTNTNTNTANNEFKEIGVQNTNTNTNTNTNVNANVNKNTTNTMPNTGVNYSSLVIIAVAGISAVYAYKKIKEYNV